MGHSRMAYQTPYYRESEEFRPLCCCKQLNPRHRQKWETVGRNEIQSKCVGWTVSQKAIICGSYLACISASDKRVRTRAQRPPKRGHLKCSWMSILAIMETATGGESLWDTVRRFPVAVPRRGKRGDFGRRLPPGYIAMAAIRDHLRHVR
jgi:hypothetical protein